METSYIDYAMSVIAARALPDVRDGLKPVQRRVLFSMIELNNGPDKPHRKCARIVGDTMGKYHPHGDSSIYGALVNMAQDWSTRYPLVDGHGNFGSVDGDGAAAMRYTEARLSKISMEMLADINKDTVDFMPNFDETEKEPVVLPSRFPNLLVNGTTGIAVGMATNIPPHNLREVINAVVKIIDNEVEQDRGTDIEEGYLVSINHTGLPILDRNQMQTIPDEFHLPRLQQLPGDIIEQLDDFPVAIDIGLPLVLPGLHVLRDETHHPDHPREVIDMLVCQKNLPHIHPVESRILQLMHDLSTATSIHHEVLLRPLLLLIRQHITGIVNLRHERIARTKHRNLHIKISS